MFVSTLKKRGLEKKTVKKDHFNLLTCKDKLNTNNNKTKKLEKL